MLTGESLEPRDSPIELNCTRKIKGWVEKRATRRYGPLGDRNSVQSRSRIDAQSNGKIYRVTAAESPRRECQRLLHGFRGFAGSADKEDPERPDSEFLDAFRDFAHLGGGESLLELLQHRITGALGTDAKRAKSGCLHRAEQLRARSGGSEVRGVELNSELATRDGLANLQRVSGRRVESRVDEVEVSDA